MKSLNYSFRYLCALLCFLFAIVSNYIELDIYNVVCIILLCLDVVAYYSIKKNLKITRRVGVILVLWIIIIGYNFMIDPVPSKKLITYFCYFFIGLIAGVDSRKGDLSSRLTLLRMFLYVLTITAVYGVIESVFGNYLDAYAVRVYASTHRLHSVFLHPIIFSAMMLQAFIINHYITQNIIIKNVLGYIYIYCIVMSLTRGTWVVLLIVVLFMLLNRKYTQGLPIIGKKIKTRHIIELIVVILLTVLIAFRMNLPSYISMILSRWAMLEGSNSITYRTATLSAVINSRMADGNILHWIMGSGYHTAQKAVGGIGLYLTTIGNSVVDNEWICIAYDFGLFGFVIMCECLIFSVKWYFDKESSREAMIISLCIIGNLFLCIFSDLLGWATVGAYTFILIGTLLSTRTVVRKHNNE